MLVEDLITNLNDFIFELKESELSDSSINRYKSIINSFIKYLQNKRLTSFAKLDYSDYKNYLKSVYKTKTVNNYVVVINKYLIFLKHDELKVKQLNQQTSHSTENVPNTVDFKRMVRVGNKKELLESVLIVESIAYTGCRVSELKYFTVESLKASKVTKVIGFYSKGKYREIVVPKWLRRKMLSYAKEKNIKDGYIFPSSDNPSNPMPRVTIWRKIRKLGGLARINLKKAHPHALRHLFGKEYMKCYKDRQQLMNIMGHSSIKTSEIYTQLSRDEMAENIDKFKM